MQPPEILEQFRVWGQEFDLAHPILDEDVQTHPLKRIHVVALIKTMGISHRYFAESFLGGLVRREHITRLMNNTAKLGTNAKFAILIACKYRFHFLENAPYIRSRRAG